MSAVQSVVVDFTGAAYPPLVEKWGGVADKWDDVALGTLLQVRRDAARRTPALLGIVELGTTMSNDTRPIFRRGAGGVEPILDTMRLALRNQRGGADGLMPLLQFDGCPTPVFRINASSTRPPHARFYPMCEYAELDELAAAFASYARSLRAADGLPSRWTWWQEPAHTISDDEGSEERKLHNFERYLDFYERTAPAVRAASPDDVVAGWQLNAANGHGRVCNETFFYLATQRFLAREARANATFPLDLFTIQNFQGELSDELLTNARAALCSGADEGALAEGAAGCPRRFSLTPVAFVRFAETKDVGPNYSRKKGVSQLLDELALIADLPDVASALHSRWEDFYNASDASGVAPMVRAALDFFRAMPAFRVPISLSPMQPRLSGRGSSTPSLWALAARNRTAQCVLLWSRSSKPRYIDLTIRLRERPAAVQSVDLYTVGPHEPGLILERSVPLPPPPATTLAIRDLYVKPYGVIASCVGDNHTERRVGDTRAERRVVESARDDLGDGSGDDAWSAVGSYSRHDVLVPRGGDPTLAPAGMGHYDSWRRTLTVAVGGGGASPAGDLGPPIGDGAADRVGLAGVVLRNVSTSAAACVELALHVRSAANATSAVAGALRLDWLDGGRPPLRSLLLASAGSGPSAGDSLWTGAAAGWPRASSVTEHAALPWAGLDANPARIRLPLGPSSPAGWTGADHGARRVRLSIILRPQWRASFAAPAAPGYDSPSATATTELEPEPATLSATLLPGSACGEAQASQGTPVTPAEWST